MEYRSHLLYRDAAGYDAYMGGWSAALAPGFLTFACPVPPDSVLDIGCGTGTLLSVAVERFPRARLCGIDPSPPAVARARKVAPSARVSVGNAERLPFAEGGFAACLSLLVLQEFADLPGALKEMRRVTRNGGAIAACYWDYGAMPLIAALTSAITSVAPEAGGRLRAHPWPPASEEALAACWRSAGLVDVATGRMPVNRRYADCDALWQSLLAGSTPSTNALAALDPDRRAAARAAFMAELRLVNHAGSLTLEACAFMVRGRA